MQIKMNHPISMYVSHIVLDSCEKYWYIIDYRVICVFSLWCPPIWTHEFIIHDLSNMSRTLQTFLLYLISEYLHTLSYLSRFSIGVVPSVVDDVAVFKILQQGSVKNVSTLYINDFTYETRSMYIYNFVYLTMNTNLVMWTNKVLSHFFPVLCYINHFLFMDLFAERYFSI